jgi:glycosyltransferase involved in cell wall biosynthesis
MRILHLLSQRPEATGSGISVRAMVREASRRGHESYLLAGVPSGEEPSVPELSENSCSFVRFGTEDLPFPVAGMSDVMPYPSTKFKDLDEQDLGRYERAFLTTVRNAVETFRPDIIHSHHLWILTSLVTRAFPHLPVVATSHGSDLRQFSNCMHLRPRVLDGVRLLRRVLALSKSQKEEIIDLFGFAPHQISVVGAGYDESLFVPVEKPRGGGTIFLYAGKLSKAKGVPELLSAFEEIGRLYAEQGATAELHLVGSGTGSEEEAIRKDAERLGNRVVLLGALPQSDLALQMGRAHIFVLPSFFEGLPLVLIEALACGCRLVATALPGIREILDSAQSSDFFSIVPLPRLIGPDTPLVDDLPAFVEALAEGMYRQGEAALKGPPSRDAARSVLERFTWSSVFERVEQVYLECLAGIS